MELFDLSGQIAVITGGNGGIGLGMARGLGQAGATVCLLYTSPSTRDATLSRMPS